MPVSLKVEIQEVYHLHGPVGNSLLSDVKFSVEGPGVVWIQGPNGVGKTVLSSVLSGKAFFHGSPLGVKGRLALRTRSGDDVEIEGSTDPRAYASHVSLWPQRVGGCLVAIHHQDDLCAGFESRLLSTAIGDKDILERLQWLMEEFSLNPHLTKSLGQCSYGETRRIELTASLSSDPSLIVADEPFSGLDLHWCEVLRKAIKTICDLRGCLWIMTGLHDPQDYGISPVYTLKLPEPRAKTEPFEAIADAVSDYAQRYHIDAPEPIEIRNLKVERKRPRRSFVRFGDFRAVPGKVTFLEGANGSGKSTVAGVLAGTVYTSRIHGVRVTGVVTGHPYDEKFIKAPSDEARLVCQDPYHAFIHRTVEEDLAHPVCPGLYRDQCPSSVSDELLEVLSSNWGDFQRPPLTFSFGQLRFLQLLLLPSCCRLVALDEPFMGLHRSLHRIMSQIMLSLANSGRIVICTTEKAEDSFPESPLYHIACSC